MDGFAFDDVAADFAADDVLDDLCFLHGFLPRFIRFDHHVSIKEKRSQTTSLGYLLLIILIITLLISEGLIIGKYF